MIFINIGVFLAVLVLGYFIGWSSGATHALEQTKEIIDTIFEEMAMGGISDDEDRTDSESGVRTDHRDMEI